MPICVSLMSYYFFRDYCVFHYYISIPLVKNGMIVSGYNYIWI